MSLSGITVALTLIKSFAASNPDYAQAYITYMSPEQFLLMTANSENGAERLNIIKEQSRPLDVDRLRSESQPIFIDIDASEKRVVGHEGRHRMYALQVAGYTQVPVLVFNFNNKYLGYIIDSSRENNIIIQKFIELLK